MRTFLYDLRHYVLTGRRLLALGLALPILAAAAFLISQFGLPDLRPEQPAPVVVVRLSTPPPPPPPQGPVVLPTATLTARQAADFSVSVEAQRQFIWPASGPLTSYFGRGHPTGIDIALNQSGASPVRASAAGKVSFSGGDTCCGYGLHVIIEHTDGYSSLYAHLAETRVAVGIEVIQGELLGFGGMTGNADGKHLHFEVQQNQQAVDPLRFLGQTSEAALRSLRTASCPVDPVLLGPGSRAGLRFTSPTLSGFQVEQATLRSLSSVTGAPQVGAGVEGQRLVMVNVEPLTAPSGKTFEYSLTVAFNRGSERISVDCTLLLQTVPSFPELNRVATTATPRPNPTMIPTRTATVGVGRTGTPSRTPTASGSRTPQATTSATQPAVGTPSPASGTAQPAGAPTRAVGTPARTSTATR